MADVASKTVESSPLGITSLLVIGVVVLAAAAAGLSLCLLPLSATAAFLVVVFTILVGRYASLLRRRQVPMQEAWDASRAGGIPDKATLPSTYFVYVLGSGGHTSELCEMIKQQFRPNPLSHRRYIITSGDNYSEHAVAKLEGLIQKSFPCLQSADKTSPGPAGTWDVVRVVRARRVHQPLWTTWYTTVLSALSIVQALVRRPLDRPPSAHNAGDFAYPNLIVTNGPGTGFIVCLVAFLMKLLFLVPSSRFCIMYIETWAHVSTLSLTGKLFYHTHIADMFVVQHQALAAKTGQRFIGQVAKYGNLLGIKKSFTVDDK